MKKELNKKNKIRKNASQKQNKNLKYNVTRDKHKDELYEYIIKSGF